MDQGKPFKKSRADDVSETLAGEIIKLHLAIKQAISYPMGHPMRARSAREVFELLQIVLSGQESHSLTDIEDELYVDQREISADARRYTSLVEISIDLARRLRRRRIRSVVFYPGMELWELETFLDIMTMRPKEMMAQGSASEILSSFGDVPHIEIVDIEYEDIQFVTDDGKEDWVDVKEILLSYLRGGFGDLTNEAYTYLSSLLEKPDQMARLIEECVDYDSVRELDNATVTQCMDRLISLGEQLADEEGKNFQGKLMEAVLQVAHPVKSVMFSESDDSSILSRLMDGLSLDEIAMFAAVESTTDEPEARLRRILDEALTSDQSQETGSSARQLAEIEEAIQRELVGSGQESLFRNTVVPLLEEMFVELEIGRLENERPGLERLLNESYPSNQRRRADYGASDMLDLFAIEDEIIESASVLLEMLESETTPDDYSDIANQLERIVRKLITKSQDVKDVRNEYLTMVFQIVSALSEQAGRKNGRPVEFQERARRAIVNICTQEIIDRILSNLSRVRHLNWNALERWVQQIGEKAVPSLVKNYLHPQDLSERQRLEEIIVSMGPIVLPEFRQWMSGDQWQEVIEDIIPIFRKIGGTKDLADLSDNLSHSDPYMRISAMADLAASKDPKAAELVLKKVWDNKEEEPIRRLALSILAEIGNEQVATEVGKILTSRRSAVLKQEAINALGIIGGEKSISILSRLLNRRRLILARRQHEDLQLHAVEALSRMGTQSAIEVLLEAHQKKKGKVKLACDIASRSYHQISGHKENAPKEASENAESHGT